MPVRRTCVAFDPGDGGRDLASVEAVPADRARRADGIDARIVIDDLRAIVVELEQVAAAVRQERREEGRRPGGGSENRHVGEECVSTCGSRWSTDHKQKKTTILYKNN